MATDNTKTSNLSFAERTAQTQAEENSWQEYNTKTKFYPDHIRKTLEELADQVFPNDAYNANAYQEAILDALVQTIRETLGIRDFWAEMADHECEYVQIDNGHLNFYNAENQKIDLTPFTQKITFEAHSSYYKQRQKERREAIAAARAQLSQLKKEIFKK